MNQYATVMKRKSATVKRKRASRKQNDAVAKQKSAAVELESPVGRPPNLRVKLESGPARVVPREAYVAAKTRQLVQFGYGRLTEETVNEQIDLLLTGKTLDSGLTVIGQFMEGEVLEAL